MLLQKRKTTFVCQQSEVMMHLIFCYPDWQTFWVLKALQTSMRRGECKKIRTTFSLAALRMWTIFAQETDKSGSVKGEGCKWTHLCTPSINLFITKTKRDCKDLPISSFPWGNTLMLMYVEWRLMYVLHAKPTYPSHLLVLLVWLFGSQVLLAITIHYAIMLHIRVNL